MKGDTMEIYRNSAAYAKENGEIQKWRDFKAETFDKAHPILLDALAKEYRVNYAEKKPSVMDKLKQSVGKNEPKICRKSEQER